MSDQLRISDEVLGAALRAMRQARQDFENAGDVSGEAQDAVGHGRLSGKIGSFSGNWKISRGKLVGAMESLESQLAALVDSFEELDTTIGTELEAAAAEQAAAIAAAPAAQPATDASRVADARRLLEGGAGSGHGGGAGGAW